MGSEGLLADNKLTSLAGLDRMEWIRSQMAWLGVASVVSLVMSLAIVPLVIRFLPEDYYCLHRAPRVRSHPVIEIILLLAKNTVASVLIIAGIAMLVLPGQGVLTIILGIALANFPGKRRLERWLVRNHSVMHGLNWLRGKMGQAPFRMD